MADTFNKSPLRNGRFERNADRVYCNILIDPVSDYPLLVHHKGNYHTGTQIE